MNIGTVLASRRDGKSHSREEIEFLVRGCVDGSIPDYQLSAWLMAAYLNPLNAQETAWLTLAMAGSGVRLDLSPLPKPWVDKHSTGGVGDKTSLVLLPLLASCGLTVVKMSGRGLGITGGTLDKLASIPGFRTDLSPSELVAQAARIGIALTGQSPELAPADKVLYALRDATGTVSSIPLIVSSVLSKKLAGGAETVVLDVKCGSGAFMKNLDEARALASALRDAAEICGLKTRIAVTDMSRPLGSAVGNALEVREAWPVLAGVQGMCLPTMRFRGLCLDLAAITLAASGIVEDEAEGRAMAEIALSSGAAIRKGREWLCAQGAAEDAIVHPERLPISPVQVTQACPHAGYLAGIDAGAVGEAVVELGGGRKKKTDTVDPSVGVCLLRDVGESVAEGDPLFTVHAASDDAAREAACRVLKGVSWSSEPVEPAPALIERL
jgi:pyrimidine-nucleoside phosphorylase